MLGPDESLAAGADGVGGVGPLEVAAGLGRVVVVVALGNRSFVGVMNTRMALKCTSHVPPVVLRRVVDVLVERVQLPGDVLADEAAHGEAHGRAVGLGLGEGGTGEDQHAGVVHHVHGHLDMQAGLCFVFVKKEQL